jgi:hypothetical protein
LVRNITQSGTSQVYWLCYSGKHTISKPGNDYIPHDKIRLAKIEIDDLPVIDNFSGREVCAVCGSPFTERHHWAPRYLFSDDCERWPKDYLCKEHHDLWHQTVTPKMRGVKTDGR